MSREFDIVIFGASGFVGKYAIQNLHESAKVEGLRWAVAGRSRDKVRQALRFASDLCSQALDDVPVLVADVDDYDSLLDMARRTVAVVNCVGPYTLYGEPVVKACVEMGTHHVDVTGEVNWLEEMHMKYDSAARESKALIVGACAYESVPSEMAVNWMREKFESLDWTLAAVQQYTRIIPGKDGLRLNHGTWDSAITFVGNFFSHRQVQRQMYEHFFTKKEPRFHYTLPSDLPLHPRLTKGCHVRVYETDCMISKRTNTMNYIYRNERPVYVAKYLTLKSWWYLLTMAAFLVTSGPFFLFAAGRRLLMRYPRFFSYGLFSKEGPTREQVAGTRFECVIRASGWKERMTADQPSVRAPDVQVHGLVKGPEVTYPTTSQCAVQSAIVLVKERAAIQAEGGIMTPGFAFRNTTLVQRLSKAPVNPVVFEFLD